MIRNVSSAPNKH